MRESVDADGPGGIFPRWVAFSRVISGEVVFFFGGESGGGFGCADNAGSGVDAALVFSARVELEAGFVGDFRGLIYLLTIFSAVGTE